MEHAIAAFRDTVRKSMTTIGTTARGAAIDPERLNFTEPVNRRAKGTQDRRPKGTHR
jgi:hypothetical protein